MCGIAHATLLLRCYTQTADIRRKPLNRYTKNEYLQRIPLLINRKAIVQEAMINTF